MTLVFDAGLPRETAQTHALVIGVGDYPHRPFGLKNLSSPPKSAAMFLNWLTDNHNNPSAPLGTVELLRSPAEPATIRGVETTHDTATISNVQLAFDNWYDRCDQSADNVAIFYFSGHGLERGVDRILLAEDAGGSKNRTSYGAFNFTLTYLGLQECKANVQCFIIDACRDTNAKLANLIDEPSALKAANGRAVERRDAPILEATVGGRQAFGEVDTPTRFTEALVNALSGPGARLLNGQWVIEFDQLAQTIDLLLQVPGAPEQHCSREGRRWYGRTQLHYFRQPPLVSVQIACEPAEAMPLANLFVQDGGAMNMDSGTPPPLPAWTPQVPAGTYQIGATFLSQAFKNQQKAITVSPPFCPPVILSVTP